MAAPQLPIDVDEKTGVWSTDGLPMIYVPQHFFVNNHKAVEQALGVDKYREILAQAGHQSAYYWCDQEAATHGLSGVDVFEHYLKRLSQRGWGLFSLEQIDLQAGSARIRLDHSAFVQQYGIGVSRKVCYMFAGWFAGAMDWVVGNVGASHCEESQCACERGSGYCQFEIRPKS
jgi:predicted hydrocarbon binding protein